MPWLANPPEKLSAILVVLGLAIAQLGLLWRNERTWASELRDEVERRPTAEEHNATQQRVAILEEELAELKAESHPDDQSYLDRMINEREQWTWLETFDGWWWKRDRLTGLRVLWHRYNEWEFRDPDLKEARTHFLDSIDSFVERATNEREDVEIPSYDPEGEIEHWEGHIRPESARKGGVAEYGAVKEELSDLGADVLSSWRNLLKIARSRPGLRVTIG